MDDLMTRSREWLQSCVNAATRSGVPEEADLEAFILAHLDGEAARTQAACDRRAEEVREACAESVRGYVPPYLGFDWDGRAAVLNTPLTATPLGDENKALRKQRDEYHAAAETWLRQRDLAFDREEVLRARVAELEERMGVVLHAGPSTALSVSVFGRAKKAEAEREALRARVAELEASMKTLDAVCAVLGREVGNRGDSEGAVDVAERIIRERDEAVAALRRFCGTRYACDPHDYVDRETLDRADAAESAAYDLLAKYPEAMDEAAKK